MSDPFGPSQSVANAVTTRPADTRTFGAADTFLQDCVSGAGGTPITAAMMNEWIANLRALLRGNGNLVSGSPVVAESHADAMLLNAVLQLIQRGQAGAAVDVGSADALVCNPTPAWLEYKPFMTLWVAKGANPNATQTPAINVSALGYKSILRADGSPIQPGDLPGSGIFPLTVDANLNLRLGVLPPTQSRIRLTANTTFYVNASTGLDTNNGSASAPWQTRQHAWNFISGLVDLNGYNVKVVLTGTFEDSFLASCPLAGAANGVGALLFKGSSLSTSIAVSGQNAWTAQGGAQFSLDTMTISASGVNAIGIASGEGAIIGYSNITFGACTLAHVDAASGGFAQQTGPVTVTAGAQYHLASVGAGSNINVSGQSLTFSGTPAFSGAFALIQGPSAITANALTTSGSATGTEYEVNFNGYLYLNGQTLPGNASGTTSNGGAVQ
ncbi:MAG TPA: hypothetical protein VGH40_11775 [Roseiarcus sp.]|jgi:hypothetical protein